MVHIKPFKGIHYNPTTIKNLNHVMAPPYDIISEKMHKQLSDQHPNNFVKLTLNKPTSSDTPSDNCYTRAQHLLHQWLTKKILIQSEKPGIYAYKITYTVNKKSHTMNGFFTLLHLDPTYQQIKAHERTLSKPKADRLNLMRACHANLEPIQLLYIDEHDTLRKQIDQHINQPFIQVTGYDGYTHTIWHLTDQTLITKIQAFLEKQILFIADGHHRYQTAINYAEEQQKKTGNTDPDAPFNYRMVILANMFDPGLAILPTHRLITHPSLNLAHLIKKLSTYFDIDTHPITTQENTSERAEHIIHEIQTTTKHQFALYTKKAYYILTLKDPTIMDELASEKSTTWRTLDVPILHKIIIEQLMGITEQTLEDHVKYTRDDTEALESVENGTYDLSILMNPTKIQELKSIAEAGEHMPQKSTYFLPKMLSGLVMYKMEE